ncbi:MAG: AAA family ATPase [Acetobacteraceae bacterium]|nr:AAA family ATPase [Acetobacteraceae bacterium]
MHVPSVALGRLLAERALGGGPRPLDAPVAEGAVLILRAPSAEWQAPLEAGLRLLAAAHGEAGEHREREDAPATRGATSRADTWDDEEEDLALYARANRDNRSGRDNGPRRPPEPGSLPPLTPGRFPMPLVEAGRDIEWTDRDRLRIEAAHRQRRAVLAVAARPERRLPPEIRQLAARTIDIPGPDEALLVELAVLLDGVAAEPGTAAWTRARRRLGPLPPLPLNPDPALLDLAHREGEGGALWLRRVAALDARRRELSAATGPRLEDLHGYGEAMDWALRLAADLRAYVAGQLRWEDVDKGALLTGPPGTGKTTLARAIARSAGVAFLSASLAEWQANRDGHLGDLLRAMRADFALARRNAACVFLNDELDGIGDRRRFDGRHRNYSTQVVNSYLELLDGAIPREGVVVIGCSNDASAIDPAILRPGRLERVIEIGLPDAAGLAGILRFHLGNDLPDLDLAPLAAAAAAREATGANVMLWVRGARQRARHAGRQLELSDLEAEVGTAPDAFPPEHVWRAAAHEAGHALGFLLVDRSRSLLGEVAVARTPLERARRGLGGSTEVDFARAFPMQTSVTPRRLAKYLRALMMGRAAEAVLCGEPSAGCGGSEQSDLAVATRIATVALGAMGMGGAGGGLLWRPMAGDPDRVLAANPRLEREVALALAEADRQALRLAFRCKPALLRLAGVLRERGALGADEVREALRGADAGAPGVREARRAKARSR